jgi:hypothetical protein
MFWIVLWFSCGNDQIDSGGSACQTRSAYQWEYFGEPFFITYCQSCHSVTSPERFGAPEGINFDNYDDVAAQTEIIRESVLIRQSMPKGGGVSEDVRTALETFLDCIVDVP